MRVDFIYDVDSKRCQGRHEDVQIAESPRHLAEEVDVIISGFEGWQVIGVATMPENND